MHTGDVRTPLNDVYDTSGKQLAHGSCHCSRSVLCDAAQGHKVSHANCVLMKCARIRTHISALEYDSGGRVRVACTGSRHVLAIKRYVSYEWLAASSLWPFAQWPLPSVRHLPLTTFGVGQTCTHTHTHVTNV